MNAVVRYLVEELGFPIRERQVMNAALQGNRAACYFAFSQFVKAPVSEAAFLNQIVRIKKDFYTPKTQYWVEKLGVKLGEEALLSVIENADSYEKENFQMRIDAAILHVQVTQKKLELMLAGKRHENEALRRLMGNEDLALMICGRTFEKKAKKPWLS